MPPRTSSPLIPISDPCPPSPSCPHRRAQQWRRRQRQRRRGRGGARSSGGVRCGRGSGVGSAVRVAAAAAWARLGRAATGERGRCSPHPLLQREPLLQAGLRQVGLWRLGCYWNLRLHVPPFLPLICFLAHFLIQVLIRISGRDLSIWIWLWTKEFWFTEFCVQAWPLLQSATRQRAEGERAVEQWRCIRAAAAAHEAARGAYFFNFFLICDGATPPVLEPVVMICTITAGS